MLIKLVEHNLQDYSYRRLNGSSKTQRTLCFFFILVESKTIEVENNLLWLAASFIKKSSLNNIIWSNCPPNFVINTSCQMQQIPHCSQHSFTIFDNSLADFIFFKQTLISKTMQVDGENKNKKPIKMNHIKHFLKKACIVEIYKYVHKMVYYKCLQSIILSKSHFMGKVIRNKCCN